MSQYILVIDQGTSSTKSMLFTLQGKLKDTVTIPLQCTYPQIDYVEQDPENLYSSVIESVQQICTQNNISADEVITCGISNQRETFLLWDKQGKALCNAIVWSCKRSNGICNVLKKEGLESIIRRKTGLLLDPYFSGTKFLQLLHEDLSLQSKLDVGEVFFGTIDTYLLYRLTKGGVFATDYTNASRTLFFNIHDLCWDDELLEIFNAKKLRLPEAHPSAHQFGKTDFEGTFSGSISINGMIGDSQGALLGHGCSELGFAKVTMGTGSSIMMNVGTNRIQQSKSLMNVICYATEENTYYGLEGIVVSCCSIIEWLKEKGTFFSDFIEAENIITTTINSNGVMFIPGFSGLGTPYWNSQTNAEIRGLTYSSTSQHIVRAAYESIVFQVRNIIDVMQDEHNIVLQSLQADGGFTNSEGSMQMLADLLEAPVNVPDIAYFSGWGAALCAGMGIGIWLENELPVLESNITRYRKHDNNVLEDSYKRWRRVMQEFHVQYTL